MPVLLAIAIGGALGALARWGVEEILPLNPGDTAWATLVVNIVGALLIGVLASSSRLSHGPSWLRPMIIIGALGGFTTFSAFAVDTGELLDDGRGLSAMLYLGATLMAGLLAVRLGATLGERSGRRP